MKTCVIRFTLGAAAVLAVLVPTVAVVISVPATNQAYEPFHVIELKYEPFH